MVWGNVDNWMLETRVDCSLKMSIGGVSYTYLVAITLLKIMGTAGLRMYYPLSPFLEE